MLKKLNFFKKTCHFLWIVPSHPRLPQRTIRTWSRRWTVNLATVGETRQAFLLQNSFRITRNNQETKRTLKENYLKFSKKCQFFSTFGATYSCASAPYKVYSGARRFACAFLLACLRRENCPMGALMAEKLNFFKKTCHFFRIGPSHPRLSQRTIRITL